MTNYLVATWRNKSKRAAIVALETVGLADLPQSITKLSQDAASRGLASLLSLGSYYVGLRDKKGFSDTNLLVLEWCASKRDEVLSALRRLGLHHLLAETYCFDDDKMCVAAIIPLDRKVTYKEYFRIASLLTGDINIKGMSDCWRGTFIAHLDPEAELETHPGDLLEIDHRTSEGGWVAVEDYKRRTL